MVTIGCGSVRPSHADDDSRTAAVTGEVPDSFVAHVADADDHDRFAGQVLRLLEADVDFHLG
jgi:hypothetical protein